MARLVVLSVLCLCACSAAAPRAQPPEVAGVSHGATTVRGLRHLDLYAQWWRPAAGPVRGVVVIVHGLKDHGGRYAGFAQGLARRGWAVYAEDLRGHGRSAGPRVQVDQFSDYVQDVEHFLIGVHGREPGVPVFLLGHSMGGAIATLAALAQPTQVQGLVLSAAALQAGKDVSPGLIAVTQALGSGIPDLPVLDLNDDLFCHDPAVVRDMQLDPLVYDHNGPAHTAAELLGALATIQAHKAELAVPVLALHGSEDRITDPEGSKGLIAAAKTSDKTLRTYDGFYHDLLHEPEHARVAADIGSWLEAHLKP